MPPDDPDARNLPAARPPASPTSTAARAQLECIAGPDKRKTFRLAPGATLIGRDESCDVALTETSISRQHSRIDRVSDGWVLKNLSSNGTRLNKKPVEEAPLADGDTIFVGAKTRLRFVVETVAISPGGRPQFRARTTAPEEEPEEEAESKEGEPKESLFKRRKKLFLALGGYLGALLIIMAILLAMRDTGYHGPSGIPQLTPLDMIRIVAPLEVVDANGLKTEIRPQSLRIVDERAEGILAEGEAGNSAFIRKEEIRAGKAFVIRGIRSALSRSPFPPSATINKSAADQDVAQALDLYTKRGQSPANLFKAVRGFQAALAELRNPGYLPDTNADQVYRAALNELIDNVQREYDKALLQEKIGHDQAALDGYNRIIKMVTETENPVVKNVVRRMGEIHKRNPKGK